MRDVYTKEYNSNKPIHFKRMKHIWTMLSVLHSREIQTGILTTEPTRELFYRIAYAAIEQDGSASRPDADRLRMFGLELWADGRPNWISRNNPCTITFLGIQTRSVEELEQDRDDLRTFIYAHAPDNGPIPQSTCDTEKDTVAGLEWLLFKEAA